MNKKFLGGQETSKAGDKAQKILEEKMIKTKRNKAIN